MNYPQKISITFLFTFLSLISFSQEICNNGIDDDADGLIDLNDTTDCVCSGISGGGGPVPSLIPNPSFENMNCCPTTYSQVNCATDWVQASGPTSDYMNTCGIVFTAASSAGLLPFPDGNGILGTIFSPGWQEYVGACLLSPMTAGTSYTIQFDIASTPINGTGDPCNGGIIDFGPIDITIFGTPSCANLPFNGNGCPNSSSGYDYLGSVTYNPVSSWGTVSITFTPTQNINAIVLGSPCTLPADYITVPSGCYPYFYYDNLILNNSGLFNGMNISPTGGMCTNDLMLTADLDTTGGTWQWYYNGIAISGQTDSLLNVSANGNGDGEYSAVYWMGTDCIRGDYTVTPPDPPTALFQFTSVCEGNTTDFTNLSSINSGSITDFYWDFGDSDTSVLEDPGHLYAIDGTYQVTLIVTSNQGCKDTLTQTVTVNPSPEADFSFNEVCKGDSTLFFDQSSVDSPSSITSYQWDINGSNSALQNPIYVFPNSGSYNVSLIVTSTGGCKDTVFYPVTVYPNPSVSFSDQNFCFGDVTQFTDLSTVAAPQNNVGWSWLINGNTVNTQNANYTFPAPGTYPVQLSVTTDLGCENQVTQNVTILDLPDPAFVYTPNCDQLPILFFDSSSIVSPYSIISWTWYINGDTIITENPSYPFQEDQVYTATLLVTADNGCSASTSLEIVQCSEILIPNVFSPNNDGHNEVFFIEGLFGSDNKILIYNRWGQLLYENNNYHNDWDGGDAPEGTYYYIFYSNTEQVFTGYLTILR